MPHCGIARYPFAKCNHGIDLRIGARERTSSLRLLIGWIQDQGHGARESVPLGSFGDQVLAAGPCEAIEPGALALVGRFPGSLEPAFRLQTVERGIQRSGLHLQQVFGRALNVFGDGVAVSWSGKQGAKDEEVERALEQAYAGSR